MTRKRRLIIVGALVAIEVLICVTIVAVLAMARFALPNARFFYVADTRAEETVEESLAADGPAALELTNTYGDVEIVGNGGDRFVVKAIKEVWGEDEREAEAKLQALKVKMAMDGGTLRVEVDDPDRQVGVVFGSVRANRVRFEITVPRGAAVSVTTRHGSVVLESTEGDAELVSHYGSIAVHDVAGSITVDTNNGDVSVRRSGSERSEVDLHSHYGDITVSGMTARKLTLDSNNGKLDLEDVTVDGDLALNTHYGRIDLDGVRARSLEVKSQNGAITLKGGQLDGELDLFTHYGAVSVSATEASEYKIETNNGAVELDGGYGSLWLHSHYGDIRVRNARDAILDLNTSNGKVTFEGSLASEADHQVESNYGAILMRLPPDTAVYLDASTTYGRIRCDFDVLVKGGDEDKEGSTSGDDLQGTINGGSDRLRIETRNGDITIEKEPSE
jgi:DUF4097 and DUF4098 domain-containing protein YvlB